MLDYYSILQVLPSASNEVIRSAYKALAKKYHPDSKQYSPDICAQKIRELNAAYEILSDINKRKKYDIEYQNYFSNQKTNTFNDYKQNNTNSSSDNYYNENTYTKEKSYTDSYPFKNHGKIFSFFKSVGQNITQEIQKNNQIIENAYLDGMSMDNYILIKRFKQSTGCKRIGYARALEEKGLLIRDSSGNIIPTKQFKDYNY